MECDKCGRKTKYLVAIQDEDGEFIYVCAICLEEDK